MKWRLSEMPLQRAPMICFMLLCALACVVSACARIAPGEQLRERCHRDDEVDDDGDGKLDCDDPDCHVFEHCRVLAAARDAGLDGDGDTGGAGPSLPADAGSTRDGASSPDATPGSAAPSSNDAATSGRDAALTADAFVPTCPLCPPDQACVDGSCRPASVAATGSYEIEVLSARVPTADEREVCFDICFSPVTFCPCLPDPYVGVFVRRPDGTERQVFQTESVSERVAASFSHGPIVVALEQGDVVWLRVYDEDERDDDDEMYECKLDLHELEAAELRCVPEDYDRLLSGDFHVRARIRRLED